MIFLTGFPSMNRCTFSLANAARSTSSRLRIRRHGDVTAQLALDLYHQHQGDFVSLRRLQKLLEFLHCSAPRHG
uniref:Uncharacterized protein n=1 Tax=Candidatus Kentrum sp. LFY TaxID=2126342 RepID=A0A450U7F1_9GAMM|nr:MAG: hypothetical protein BECKLFY1418B_GA0070995_100765 [Candidatus Kentron sp. LFY]